MQRFIAGLVALGLIGAGPVYAHPSAVSPPVPLPNWMGGSGLTAAPTNGQIPIGNGTGYTLAGLTGTANRITVTNGAGTITLSGPQDWHTAAKPQFAGLGIGAAPPALGRIAEFSDASTAFTILVLRSRGTTNGDFAGLELVDGGGTNINSQIRAARVSATNSDLEFFTMSGGAVGERFRVTPGGVLSSLGATPTNVTAAGAGIFGGGIAITDVANAWIDDATQGNGTVQLFIGNNTINVSPPSDVHLKRDIVPTKVQALGLLNRIEVVDYYWRDPEMGTDQQFGWTAQQVHDVIPEVVTAPATGTWYVQGHKLMPYAIKAIQELEAKVEALEGAQSQVMPVPRPTPTTSPTTTPATSPVAIPVFAPRPFVRPTPLLRATPRPKVKPPAKPARKAS